MIKIDQKLSELNPNFPSQDYIKKEIEENPDLPVVLLCSEEFHGIYSGFNVIDEHSTGVNVGYITYYMGRWVDELTFREIVGPQLRRSTGKTGSELVKEVNRMIDARPFQKAVCIYVGV